MNKHEKINAFIGGYICGARVKAQVSQKELSARLDVTTEQLYRYEMSIETISAGKLAVAIKYLKIPTNVFFDALRNVTMNSVVFTKENPIYAIPGDVCG